MTENKDKISVETTGPAAPETFSTDAFLRNDSLELSYAEKKDSLITKVALGIISGSAAVSALGLLFPFVFGLMCRDANCSPQPVPDWAPETLRLSLVASLAFVMGTGGKSN